LSDLQAKMRDHALAASPINAAIASLLRHKEILIEPVEKGYLLKRADGTPVVRLSEGEKAAVTFCYFIATLLSWSTARSQASTRGHSIIWQRWPST